MERNIRDFCYSQLVSSESIKWPRESIGSRMQIVSPVRRPLFIDDGSIIDYQAARVLAFRERSPRNAVRLDSSLEQRVYWITPSIYFRFRVHLRLPSYRPGICLYQLVAFIYFELTSASRSSKTRFYLRERFYVVPVHVHSNDSISFNKVCLYTTRKNEYRSFCDQVPLVWKNSIIRIPKLHIRASWNYSATGVYFRFINSLIILYLCAFMSFRKCEKLLKYLWNSPHRII